MFGSKADESAFADAEWMSFRESYMKQRVFTPAEVLKMYMHSAIHVQEIDDLLVGSMDSGMFESDPGLALFLALDRYHWTEELGLGPEHVAKCLWAIDAWEKHYKRKAHCFYYELILRHYVDTFQLHRNPHLSSSDVYELVVGIIEIMQAKAEDGQDCGIVIGRVWETLRLALQNRSGVTSSGFKMHWRTD